MVVVKIRAYTNECQDTAFRGLYTIFKASGHVLLSLCYRYSLPSQLLIKTHALKFDKTIR